MVENKRASWCKLREQFSELRTRHLDRLSASWREGGWIPIEGGVERSKPWRFTGTSNADLIAQFEPLAERGSVLLGGPAGPAGIDFWLDRLKADDEGVAHPITLARREEDGTTEEVAVYVIQNVCEASEQLCFRLESAAIAEAGSSSSSRVGTALSRSVESRGAAEELKKYLEAKNLSGMQFAKRVRISEKTIRKFLKGGKVSRTVFEAIASGMGTTSEQLLSDTD